MAVVITQGRYVTSAVNPLQYPDKRQPEVAFMGRSNVGKSSLINSLTRVTNLARVSAHPGKTQTINFYDIGLKTTEDSLRQNFYLVDLPGYGYAKVAKNERRSWAKFIEEYLLKSRDLLFVCQLIDIRHSPPESDRAMFRWLMAHNLPTLIIATKADKVGKNAVSAGCAEIKASLGEPNISVLPYSVPQKIGRTELLAAISDALIPPKPNEVTA